MDRLLKKRIDRLVANGSSTVVAEGRKGIEKESLRVTPDGNLAGTPHPAGLGSAMSNRFITTDFSEALLEFVTPAAPRTWEVLRILCEIHQFTYSQIGDELLWVSSMPCLMTTDDNIPLARYGTSNVGRMKTVYRSGLGYRYGRRMQTIAGVHFNYSLPDDFWPYYQDSEKSSADPEAFRSRAYMGMVRNFRRLGWLVLYLLGASPALCRTFFKGESGLSSFDEHTVYEPYATSLRMSNLGYSNSTQARLRISLNSLEEYIRDLSSAICTPEPRFQEIGVKVDGEYRQLNANQLQIENEYYSSVRPKRVARSGERPTAALRRGGIEYVEIRSIDVNVFDPVGVNQNAMRFMEAFLIYCLLRESPPLDEDALSIVQDNHDRTAKNGRDPAFTLRRDGRQVPLRDWAGEILGDVRVIASVIDGGDGAGDYVQSVEQMQELIANPDATPSARVLSEMRSTGTGFFRFALAQAMNHKAYFSSLAELDDERLRVYSEEASQSVERQASIEASDRIGFDEYLQQYFSSQGCS